MSTQVDLKEGMIVNLVKVSEKDAKTTADSTDVIPVSDADGNIKKMTVNDILSPVAGGIGNAVTSTVPTTGINTYNVQGGAGTYTNFLSAAATPIVFDNTADSMATKNWQMRKVGTYWQKYEVKNGSASKAETAGAVFSFPAGKEPVLYLEKPDDTFSNAEKLVIGAVKAVLVADAIAGKRYSIAVFSTVNSGGSAWLIQINEAGTTTVVGSSLAIPTNSSGVSLMTVNGVNGEKFKLFVDYAAVSGNTEILNSSSSKIVFNKSIIFSFDVLGKIANLYAVYQDEFRLSNENGDVFFKIDRNGNILSQTITAINNNITTLQSNVTTIQQSLLGYGNTCRTQKSPGTYYFPTIATVTGSSTVYKDTSTKKWAKYSSAIKMTGGDTINIPIGQTITGAQTIGVWMFLPFKYNQGNIDRVVVSLTLSGSIVGSSLTNNDQYWQYNNQQPTGFTLMKWLPSDFGSPASFDGIRMQVILTGGAVAIGNYKCEFYIDSVVINQKHEPTCFISYDGPPWQESYDAGLYAYHKTHNIPFNFTDKDINQNTGGAARYVEIQNLIKDGLCDVCIYTSSMRTDNTTYPTYAAKRNFIKGEQDTGNNKAYRKVIAAACSGNQTDDICNIAMQDAGFKVIRAIGNPFVNYWEDFVMIGLQTYYGLPTDTPTTETNRINAAKAYIDRAIALGSAICIFTHAIMPVTSLPNPNVLHTSDTVWYGILAYLESKVASGEISWGLFSEMHYASTGTFNK